MYNVTIKLVRAACVRCHGTKCPLLTAFVPFFLSVCITFLPEGVFVGVWNFAWAPNSQKYYSHFRHVIYFLSNFIQSEVNGNLTTITILLITLTLTNACTVYKVVCKMGDCLAELHIQDKWLFSQVINIGNYVFGYIYQLLFVREWIYSTEEDIYCLDYNKLHLAQVGPI